MKNPKLTEKTFWIWETLSKSEIARKESGTISLVVRWYKVILKCYLWKEKKKRNE